MDSLFDLNIEQVLEHWEPEHALREIIANALDEQILTKTKSIDVYQKNGNWHVRDYGRGLQYIHFTQNENKEKLESPFLIGKFGVGLKDALAVFYRKGISVEIDSKYAHITLTMSKKTGFDVETLHAVFSESKNVHMEGTDFVISGITKDAVEKAKSMFLYFNKNAVLLEKTRYGEVYLNQNLSDSVIYINGVQVAFEDNFLFTYNITNINAQIKKALNRERSNVGRTAYSDTIKNILRQCTSNDVLLPLVEDLKNIMRGTNRDESSWVDVASYAAKTLNKSGNVVFMTPDERASLTNQQVEILEQSGKKLIMITDNVYSKLGGAVTTFSNVYQDYNDNFQYKFVKYEMMSGDEKKVFDTKEIVFHFLKKYNYRCDVPVKVSEQIRVDAYGEATDGVWDTNLRAIIIKRSVLSSKEKFLGVLAHEFAHYSSGYPDNSRDFESILTEMLGYALFDATVIENSEKSASFINKIFKR